MSKTHSFTGREIRFDHPEQIDVCIEDIAHSLSLICRFNGHCHEFYSVAQHSVFVSSLLDDEHALPGLMHDAAEAYIGDIIVPVRETFGAHRIDQVEQAIAWRIQEVLEISDWTNNPVVYAADKQMLAIEVQSLMHSNALNWPDVRNARVDPTRQCRSWHPTHAEHQFLIRYKHLKSITRV
jgi:uncharacterized protein